MSERLDRDDCDRVHPWGPETHITVRESTAAERVSVGAFWATDREMAAKNYVICRFIKPDVLLGAFGLIDGADTREEVVFWAERMASKNGYHFIRPDGWESVVAALPPEEGSQ